jgi:hypothetical protein
MFHCIDAKIATLILSVAAAAAGDRVPTFQVEPHCRAVAAEARPVGDPAVCVQDEQKARAQLVKEWNQFTRLDKDHCLPLSRMAPEPTYSGLLTCLEVERDARLLRQKQRGTTGAGTKQDAELRLSVAACPVLLPDSAAQCYRSLKASQRSRA